MTLAIYIIGGAFLAISVAAVCLLVGLEIDREKIRKEQLAAPDYRITPAVHGSWRLSRKTLSPILNGRYCLSWRPEGIYSSKEEAEKDLLHLTQSEARDE